MLKINITADISGALRLVNEELPKALPYVQATLLTGMAKRIQERVKTELPKSFDRPTPFTVRGVFVKSASKTAPVAEVYFPESEENRGQAKREYIRPGALGTSSRRQKRTEYLLSKTGFLPYGWVTTPGTSAEKHGYMDAYGNVKPRIYAQIVNVLQIKRADSARARSISAASQKRAQRMGVDAEFFAVAPGRNKLGRGGSWLPPGVYKRTGPKGDKLHQVLKFVSRAAYTSRIDLEALARDEVRQNLQTEFDAAFSTVKARFAARDARSTP